MADSLYGNDNEDRDTMESEPTNGTGPEDGREWQTPHQQSSERAEESRVSDRQVRNRLFENRELSVRPETNKARQSNPELNYDKPSSVSMRRSRTRLRETPTCRRKSLSSPRNLRQLFRSPNDSHRPREGRRRHRSSHSESDDEFDTPIRRLLKRRRSRSPSRHARRQPPFDDDLPGSTQGILHKFLDVLTHVKGQSTSKLSAAKDIIPEFDPMAKDQTIVTWLTKVEECADIYEWSEREIIHFALPRLTGVARTWYQGLDSVLFTWFEWKRKLIESFPCRQDYAELLTEMLAKRARYGECLEQYFYSKINLLNRCGITGRKAVDCLLHGIEDRAVRVGAQAARFRHTEDVLKYLKTVKYSTESRDRVGQSRKPASQHANNTKGKTEATFAKKITNSICYNCKEEGHRSRGCSKPPIKCGFCGKMGHLEEYCRNKLRTNPHTTESSHVDTKPVKQIAMINETGESNLKYVFEIHINKSPIMCQVDLGSECTLIKESEAKRLQLDINHVCLPMLRGIGGHLVQPLGKCNVNVMVQGIKEHIEVLVVDDSTLKHPVLLGHTFTEKPNIMIVKTSDQVVFEKVANQKLFLMVSRDFTICPQQIAAVPVESRTKYTGPIYVNGTIRCVVGKEHYLLPGEYKLDQGSGLLLVQNMSNNSVTFTKGSLFTRAILIADEQRICTVTFDDKQLDDNVRCGNRITPGQKLDLQKLLIKYNECFSSGLHDIGFTNAGEMVIELNDTEPVVYRPYRLSYSERTTVRNMVQEMIDAGIIRESSSQYASPIVLVKKKTGDIRLCVDYRALNKRTKKDHYPIPLIDDQLDRLAGNKLFISLDLASGYYQIPIAKDSQDKTAFITPDGLYEYTKMPFGLVNAPAVFQRTINKILSDAKIKYALVYMDDVLIPARSFEEGLARLEEVLGLLKQGGLTLKLSKCNFFMDSIDFLGFEINADGIKPGEKKIDSVSKFPVPKSQRELQQFIGLASFFRRFVKGFAMIARPLTDLLRKDSVWKWESSQNEAFETIKSSLVQRPLLALYDPSRETEVHTDACKFGVGGILLQKDNSGLLRPIAYHSKKTTPDEQKLHSFELETLAVISALNKFRVYLIGIPFKILTDCNALRSTLSKRDLIPRIARWWIQFQEFDCVIEYRSGINMSHADALSRNPVHEAGDEPHVLDVLTIGSEDWIATVQSDDDEIRRIKEILSDSKSEQIKEIVKNFKVKNGKVYRIVGEGDQNLRWVVPKGVRWQIAKMNHDDLGHFGFDKTLARVQQVYWFPKMRRFIKKYVKSCLECAHSKGVTGKQPGELHPIPKIEIPFHTVHADHLGPFVRSKRGNCYLLVLVDSFTKFINIKPVRNTKSTTSIRAFREHIACFGAPTRLVTDRGTSFTSNSFRAFVKQMGIKHILNAVATPRANGQCERFNRTILSALVSKSNSKDDRNWDSYILDIQIGLNTTVHKTTGKSPSELLFGFNINSTSENFMSDIIDDTRTSEDLDQVRSEASVRIAEQQAKDKNLFDSKRAPIPNYSNGDLISVKRDVPSDGSSKKLAAKYQGPYRIIKVLPNDRFVIEDTPLTRKHGQRRYENIVAIDKIKPWMAFNRNLDSTDSDNTSDQETSDVDEH